MQINTCKKNSQEVLKFEDKNLIENLLKSKLLQVQQTVEDR